MVRTHSSAVALWLCLAVVVLIGYGSLYPFNFVLDGTRPGLQVALTQLTWARAGRADQLRNILLYVPFGFCLMLWLRTRMHRALGLLLVAVAGAALSLAIELLQIYLPTRVPSWRDFVLNVGGALVGAASGLVWRRLSAQVYVAGNARREPGCRSALVVVCLWVLWRLAEFDPHLSLTRLKLALLPLMQWQVMWPAVLQFLLLWLVVAQAVYGYARRDRSNEVLLTVIAVVFLGRLLLTSPPFTPAELIALALLLPTLVLLHYFRSSPQQWVVLGAFSILFACQSLTPFNPGGFQGDFDLWPFLEWFKHGMPMAAEPLFKKLFMFSALIWLLKDVGLSLRQAWFSVVLIVLVFEVIYLWLPDRGSTITNPMLALLVGWLMYRVSHERLQQRRPRFR